ncbi:hypothetical protein PQR02_18010 [Paraburkholderia sediminicola]|uniref:Uncharacterized protein n=1 Tax=Paraburkholderia rhynchosiae TaxID=487049 RepID=A0ACC7N839_9BURK
MVELNGERAALVERGKGRPGCGDSGVVLEKAAIEVRGVALFNGVNSARTAW